MQGARYLNTRTRTWPSISDHDKSAYVDSVGEVKTTCSSGASNKLKLADGRGPLGQPDLQLGPLKNCRA